MRPGGSIHPRAKSFKYVIDWIYGNGLLNDNHEKSKHQKPNLKWFDKLTTLSQVEGQMPMTEIQNSKQANGTRELHMVFGMFRSLDFRI